ncbi:hypothetical protein FRC19_003905 [Serendipita sp. 401]|nr:hypothetical protein FRC15_009143 [Serendipita sp. 397]KAG8797524.1 hypothetical protein FRC16_008787 [Serendipita sp. 398]KAG8828566.1 hypothetical protein FRC19_003905 [Serendipita sp. 401]KAG8865962.1 hypothetical protein FRC20_009232 [Serendipita sp. 405]KAG9058560.1 hypothetical protein FS842_007982 [Serendipita sp. 407]
MQSLIRISRTRPQRVSRIFAAPCLYQRRGISLSDYVPTGQEHIATQGEIKDFNNKEKRQAKRRVVKQGRGNLFDSLSDAKPKVARNLKHHLQHKIPLRPTPEKAWFKTYKIREKLDARTVTLHVSHRKLNKLANQISGKPLDYAILQMQFSEKRVSSQVQRLLLEAKQRAKELQMNLDAMVVEQAWVGKGADMPTRIDIRARGKFGIKRRSRSHITIRLGRGTSPQQAFEKKAQRRLDKIKLAESFAEEKKVRYTRPQWAW